MEYANAPSDRDGDGPAQLPHPGACGTLQVADPATASRPRRVERDRLFWTSRRWVACPSIDASDDTWRSWWDGVLRDAYYPADPAALT